MTCLANNLTYARTLVVCLAALQTIGGLACGSAPEDGSPESTQEEEGPAQADDAGGPAHRDASKGRATRDAGSAKGASPQPALPAADTQGRDGGRPPLDASHASGANKSDAGGGTDADLAAPVLPELFGDGGLFAPLDPGLPRAGLEPDPSNVPECPKAAPENPIGSCIGVPIYALCSYGGGKYNCVCDWYHWLCL